MSEQYQYRRLPLTTVSPSELSALDIGNASVTDFRPTQWWDRNDSIFEQSQENDVAFVSFLEKFGDVSMGLTQPIVKWRVGRPADLWTRNGDAIAAADTYLDLDDSYIAKIGFTLDCIQYGATYRVLDTDDDKSEGWTNDAGDTCNVKVERLTGPAVAIPANQVLNAGHAPMGELGTPKRINTTIPGDPTWNTMSYVGIYGSISNVQMESAMNGEWGTHTKVMNDLFFTHKLAKQHSLLFGQRWFGTDTQASEGQMYMAAGLRDQIKTHTMEAGSLGVNLVWPKLNDFFELTFDSELSSASKDHFCGAAQFRDIRKTALDYGADVQMLGLQSGVQNANSLGTDSMVITLQSGRQIRVHMLRKAFSAPNLVDWGFTVDAGNIGYFAYKGISERVYNDIESPAQAITLKSDALVDTWLLAVKDESTCAAIRGGTSGLIVR